jgi:fatty-acyl-CoA synthase
MMKFRTLIGALQSAPSDKSFVTSWIDEDEQRTISFGEFRRQAGTQAASLVGNGVAAGDRVIIIMPQGIPAMTAFVGAMMLGAVPAFLAYPNFKVDPGKYRSGLAGVTANLRAKVIVIDEEFPDEMLGHVRLGEGTTLLRMHEHASATDNVDRAISAVDPASLAFIQHSAGTTGLQKGVALTHLAVMRQLEHLAHGLRVNAATDRIYTWLPLYHDMGLIACFMLPMVCHLPVVMQSPVDWVMHPESMLEIISEHRCTLAWMPNFAFQFIPRRTPESRREKYNLKSLRALINCSEPVRAHSVREFSDAFERYGLKKSALQSSYAMAEDVFAITQSDVRKTGGSSHIWADAEIFRGEHRVVPGAKGDRDALEFVSSGSLLPGHEICIVSQSGERLGDGHVGEILLKSDCLFEGYYNRDDLTDQDLRDGWYHTSDLGFLYQDELYVVGRRKDLMIIGGENIYPHDIEEIVATHPAVHDGRTIAMGLYNPDLGTEEIVVVAETTESEAKGRSIEIEQEIRSKVVAATGLAVKIIFLKPPRWIVKSTAGKPARSDTRQKLMLEHPELNSLSLELSNDL